MVLISMQDIMRLLIQAIHFVWSIGSALVCGEFAGCASFFVVLAVLGNLVMSPLIAYISNWFLLALYLHWTMFNSSLEASFPMVEEYVSIRCLSDKTTQYPSLLLFPSYSSCYSFLYPTVRKCATRCVVHKVLYIPVHHTTLRATSSHDSVQMFHTLGRYT